MPHAVVSLQLTTMICNEGQKQEQTLHAYGWAYLLPVFCKFESTQKNSSLCQTTITAPCFSLSAF